MTKRDTGGNGYIQETMEIKILDLSFTLPCFFFIILSCRYMWWYSSQQVILKWRANCRARGDGVAEGTSRGGDATRVENAGKNMHNIYQVYSFLYMSRY